MTTTTTPKSQALLRKALLANAAFSTVTGIGALFFAGPIATWMGMADPLWLRLLGPGLLGFAGLLVWTAKQNPIDTRQALHISLADYGWVLGSAALLLFAPEAMNASGKWLVVDVALVVGALGTAQLIGIGRIHRADSGLNAVS